MTPEDLGLLIKEATKQILLTNPQAQEAVSQGIINNDFINNSFINAQNLLIEDEDIETLFNPIAQDTLAPAGSINTVASKRLRLVTLAVNIGDINALLGEAYAKGFGYGRDTDLNLDEAQMHYIQGFTSEEKQTASSMSIMEMFKAGFIEGRKHFSSSMKDIIKEDVYEDQLFNMMDIKERRANRRTIK